MAHRKRNTDLPRKKKKKLQRQAQKILAERQGLENYYDAPKPNAIQTQKIIANDYRNEQRKQRLQSYRDYAISQGVPASIITNKDISSKEKTDQFIKDYHKQRQTEERRLSRERLFNEKVDLLTRSGLSRDEAVKIVGTPSRQKSFGALREYTDNITIDCKKSLYIGFADVSGKGFHIYKQDAESSINDIRDRLSEAKSDIDNSDNWFGDFVIDFGSEEAMDDKAWTYYQRSMNFAAKHPKFDGKQYHKITVSDQWSRTDFLNLINSCVQQMPNKDVIPFINKAKDYCSSNGLDWLTDL